LSSKGLLAQYSAKVKEVNLQLIPPFTFALLLVDLFARLQEKMIKILDIWTKSQTFSPAALARVQAIVDSTGTTGNVAQAGAGQGSTTPVGSPKVGSTSTGTAGPDAADLGRAGSTGVGTSTGTGAGAGVNGNATGQGEYSCHFFPLDLSPAIRRERYTRWDPVDVDVGVVCGLCLRFSDHGHGFDVGTVPPEDESRDGHAGPASAALEVVDREEGEGRGNDRPMPTLVFHPAAPRPVATFVTSSGQVDLLPHTGERRNTKLRKQRPDLRPGDHHAVDVVISRSQESISISNSGKRRDCIFGSYHRFRYTFRPFANDLR